MLDTQPHPKCTQTSFCPGPFRTVHPPSEIKGSASGCQLGKGDFRSGFSPDYALSPLWPLPPGPRVEHLHCGRTQVSVGISLGSLAARPHGTLARHCWVKTSGICYVCLGQSSLLFGSVFPSGPRRSGQDVAESPLTCGWKVLLGQLFLFRKTLGLPGSMESRCGGVGKVPGDHNNGAPEAQRSKPRAELDLKAVLSHRPAAHFAKPRNDI